MPVTSAKLLPQLGARWATDVPVSAEEAFAVLEASAPLPGHEGDIVWLDSSSVGAHVIGVGSHRLVVTDGRAELDSEPVPGDAVAALEYARQRLPGAWVGWFGYEAGVRLLGLEPLPHSGVEAAWLLLDRWVVVDGGRAQLQSRDGEPWSLPYPSAVPGGVQPKAMPVAASELRWRDSDQQYAAKVEECLGLIRDGHSYVLCLTTSITGPAIDPVATHARLRTRSPVHHGGFVRIGATTLVSASPETFLHVDGGVVRTRPVKGTRRRGSGDDAALARELHESGKERAENVMIVDLCRNDVQRVSEPGSVAVTSLLAVETHTTVHQLVSTVEGKLRQGLGPLEAVRALFPAGSMTGAPKRRSVELLARLEGAPRGAYSGCFGLVAGDTCQFAMVIRSIIAEPGRSSIGVGGGVTALSDPAAEVDEVHVKAAALVESLVAARM